MMTSAHELVRPLRWTYPDEDMSVADTPFGQYVIRPVTGGFRLSLDKAIRYANGSSTFGTEDDAIEFAEKDYADKVLGLLCRSTIERLLAKAVSVPA